MQKLYNYFPDGTKEVKGYKHENGLYLMKKYEWGNYYSWVISREERNVWYSYEFAEAERRHEVVPVSSFKEGKEQIEKYSKIN